MRKTFVLDTNILLSDANAMFCFPDGDVVIPMIVLEELNNHKSRSDEVGRNAREVSRKLTALIADTDIYSNSISLGEGHGQLEFLSYRSLGYPTFDELVPEEFREKSGDNQILAVCVAFQRKYTSEMALVSRDGMLRIKACALGIPVEDYKRLDGGQTSASLLYTGTTSLVGEYDVSGFYINGHMELPEEVTKKLHPNEYLHVKDAMTGQSALMRYKDGKGHKLAEHKPVKLQAKNKEQTYALDLLMDPKIPLVSMVGFAGTGKTILALAAGLAQVLERKTYGSLVICRPVQPLGKDIGYLPGTIEEKMEPWIAPIKDNLKFLLAGEKKNNRRDEATMQLLFDNGTIEIQALTYLRGRSIPSAFILIDEAQNLDVHELKTIITRAGEGTKIVLIGDIEQIDNRTVDSLSNGLTVAIEKFKQYEVAGHVTLLKGERSVLATLAAQIL